MFIYHFSDEQLRPAKIHYGRPRCPNKRPSCKLSARHTPPDVCMIVTDDPGLVTCGQCLRSLGEREGERDG